LKFEILDRCVKIIPSKGEPRECIWDQEIEDVQNYTILFGQAIGLHLDFLQKGEQ